MPLPKEITLPPRVLVLIVICLVVGGIAAASSHLGRQHEKRCAHLNHVPLSEWSGDDQFFALHNC